MIDAKEKEIDSLEKEKETALSSFDEQIDKLNTIKESWSNIADSYQRLANIDFANSMFGSNWQDGIFSGDTSYFDKIGNLYNNVETQITSIEREIEANESRIESVNNYVKAWQNGQISIQEAYAEIQHVVGNTEIELEATKERTETTSLYAKEWEETQAKVEESLQLIEASQKLAKDNEKIILDERLLVFKTFADEMKTMAKSLSDSIATLATSASSSLASMLSDLDKAKSASSKIASLSTTTTTTTTSSKGTEITKKHDGMTSGYVGDTSSSDARDIFERITQKKLAPDEIPIIAKKGEPILTLSQKDNVLSNIGNAYAAGLNSSAPSMETKNNSNIESYQMGDIVLNNVQNTDQLAKAIKSNLLQKISQID